MAKCKPDNKKKRLEVYFVIGDSNSGKSSVLRHLGGFPKGFSSKSNKFQITTLQFLQGPSDVGLMGYRSLQESKIRPIDFVNKVGQAGRLPSKIFVPLQYSPKPKGVNLGAADYIRYFHQNTNWNIIASVLLDPNQNNHLQSVSTLPAYANCIYVYSDRFANPPCPTNVVAVSVRSHFDLV